MSNSKLNSVAAELTDTFVKQLQSQISKQVTADIAHKLAQIDINQTVRDYVSQALASSIKNLTFPQSSIPAQAIDFENFAISGHNVTGGIIRHFGSTGIQDDANQCQLTVMDEATVIENKLVAADVEIKGDLTVDGDLKLLGEVPTDSPLFKDLVAHSAGIIKLSMDGQFFLQYADKVFEKIKSDGIDLTKLTVNGNEILQGNTLGFFITETNIQKLGELRTITVTGDSNFSNTLYARNKRVGINTEEPAGALAVWDEECEIVARKLQKNVSIIGSLRNQKVVLSSNSKENLVLEIDGSVSIEKLNVGKVQLSSASEQPNFEAKRGSVVFNENPETGKPLGWVSLGSARWASFGTVN